MPDASATPENTAGPKGPAHPESTAGPRGPARPESTARITRGVRRALAGRGYASVVEFPLSCGRRADVLAVNAAGEIAIVEVKSSVEDFRADQKWPEYQPWCDAFWFAVGPDFPAEMIPEDCGLLVADAYGAAVLREPPLARLAPARRKSLLAALALCAAGRLHRIEDPAAGLDGPGG